MAREAGPAEGASVVAAVATRIPVLQADAAGMVPRAGTPGSTTDAGEATLGTTLARVAEVTGGTAAIATGDTMVTRKPSSRTWVAVTVVGADGGIMRAAAAAAFTARGADTVTTATTGVVTGTRESHIRVTRRVSAVEQNHCRNKRSFRTPRRHSTIGTQPPRLLTGA